MGGDGKEEYSIESTKMKREKLQHDIAAILDHPSVFMGGPSHHHLRKADAIMKYLTRNGII